MSATPPAAASPTLTWAEAPGEYRRQAYAAAATKSLVPLLSVTALSLALAAGRSDLAAWIGPIGMVAMTALTVASNLNNRRTAQMVLPSEHKVRFPRALGTASAITAITAITGHVAFAGLLLASDAPLAAPFAIFIGILTSAPAWQVAYKKVEGRKFWVAALSSIATLAIVATWAPSDLPAAVAWMTATPVVVSSILFAGGALDGELKQTELRPWAVRPFEALVRHFAKTRA